MLAILTQLDAGSKSGRKSCAPTINVHDGSEATSWRFETWVLQHIRHVQSQFWSYKTDRETKKRTDRWTEGQTKVTLMLPLWHHSHKGATYKITKIDSNENKINRNERPKKFGGRPHRICCAIWQIRKLENVEIYCCIATCSLALRSNSLTLSSTCSRLPELLCTRSFSLVHLLVRTFSNSLELAQIRSHLLSRPLARTRSNSLSFSRTRSHSASKPFSFLSLPSCYCSNR